MQGGVQMNEQERDFKGVWIPKEVWLDTRLTALDKVILTEIDSLDNSERGCYASNKHIAEFCQCSEAKVSKSISLLIKLGYIYLQHFDGRQRELKSRFTKNDNQPCKNYKADYKKIGQSNTNNNTSNNTNNKKKESKKNSFDEIITTYSMKFELPVCDEITDLLGEWLKVRKAKRAAMTDRAIQMNIEKLDKLALKSGLTVVEYLKEVICRGWAAFYEIKTFGNNTPQPEQQEQKRYGGVYIE